MAGFKRVRKPGFRSTSSMPSAGPKARKTSVGGSTNIFRKPIRKSRKGFKK